MLDHGSLLSSLSGPADLKRLRPAELERLSGEIREKIVSTMAHNGGHLASNLGVVELSIALHRVFESPNDRIVWDVGHQCYAHKLLTGRQHLFDGIRKAGGIAGFPKREESPHDAFNTGHASTSISAALGMLVAKDLEGSDGRAVAVIGDGALTGGLAYEALSHCGHLKLPLIVILNDNTMSISPNVGGLSKYLSRLSMKAKYQSFRRSFDSMAKKLPFIGDFFFECVLRLKRAVKAVFYFDNFFVDLGFEYVGPIDGHNIRLLSRVLADVRQLGRPVVVHVLTRKGKGYCFAEDDPGSYHGVGAFSVDSGLAGKSRDTGAGKKAPTFTEALGTALLEAADADGRIVAITAAMEKGTGLSAFRNRYPKRFFDVGIAEGHAVTFAAGLASQGRKPVVAIYSTFIQRTVDQLIHDVALQNLPVVFVLDRSGFVEGDGETHQGLFDIALFGSIPRMTVLAPSGEAELRLMLRYALELPGPAMIRYPKSVCPPELPEMALPLEPGRGVWLRKNPESRLCLAFSGSSFAEANRAAELLGGEVDLYNIRFHKPVERERLVGLMNSYDAVVFVEEGIRPGSFGEYARSLAHEMKCRAGILALAADESYADSGNALGTRPQLLARAGLDGEGIARQVREWLAQ